MKKVTLSLIIAICSIASINASNFYWVGGTGNWSDYASHWATTSGGSVFYTTIPTLNDDVFFDGNSFSAAGIVTFDISASYCKNFDCSLISYGTNFKTAIGFTNISLNVYGSLTSSALADWVDPQGSIYITIDMKAPVGTASITSNSSKLNNVAISGGATFNLADNLWVTNLNISGAGSFNTNNYDMHITQDINSSQGGVFNIGSSHVEFYNWLVNSPVTSTLPTLFFGNRITCNSSVVPAIQIDSLISTGLIGGSIYSAINCAINCNYLQGPTGLPFVLSSPISFSPLVSYVHKAVFNNDINIDRGVFDSLMITTPGKTISIVDTVVVNDQLYIETLPGFPAQISGGVISKAAGQVCLDYMLLQNTTATGGAQFFVGSNSIDLGGNSGWSFTNCTPYISNVWPGDANYDLTCDNLDLLNVGLAYGYTGIARTAPTINWVAQLGTDWLQQFVNGANLKHADCDGDGTVSFPDTLAISQNYGLTHPARVGDNSGTNSFGAPLYFDVPTTSLQPGSVVTVPINFGTSTVPVNNLYGIAFTVDYDASLIQPNSVSINYAGSWLPTAGSYLHMERDFYGSNKIDMAITRTDHLNVSDYGTIANLVFTVANNASGPLQLGFSKIRAVSANELEIPVQANTVSVITSVNSVDPENTFTVFPNPFKNQVAVINSNYKTGQPIEVFNIYGTKIYSGEFATEKVLLNTDTWRNGVYFIRTGGNVVKVNKAN